MKLYAIINRVTKEKAIVEADSAQEACERYGWMIGDCHVRELKEEAPGVYFPLRVEQGKAD